jgi:hypothetical protein
MHTGHFKIKQLKHKLLYKFVQTLITHPMLVLLALAAAAAAAFAFFLLLFGML